MINLNEQKSVIEYKHYKEKKVPLRDYLLHTPQYFFLPTFPSSPRNFEQDGIVPQTLARRYYYPDVKICLAMEDPKTDALIDMMISDGKDVYTVKKGKTLIERRTAPVWQYNQEDWNQLPVFGMFLFSPEQYFPFYPIHATTTSTVSREMVLQLQIIDKITPATCLIGVSDLHHKITTLPTMQETLTIADEMILAPVGFIADGLFLRFYVEDKTDPPPEQLEF